MAHKIISKYRSRDVGTSLISVRVDNDLLSYVRKERINLSSSLNHLLRSYLYIHSLDDSLRFERLNVQVPTVSINVDVYDAYED